MLNLSKFYSKWKAILLFSSVLLALPPKIFNYFNSKRSVIYVIYLFDDLYIGKISILFWDNFCRNFSLKWCHCYYSNSSFVLAIFTQDGVLVITLYHRKQMYISYWKNSQKIVCNYITTNNTMCTWGENHIFTLQFFFFFCKN